MTDLEVLNHARGQVRRGKSSSLVEWTLDKQWTNRHNFTGNRLRGSARTRDGYLAIMSGTLISGEIDV